MKKIRFLSILIFVLVLIICLLCSCAKQTPVQPTPAEPTPSKPAPAEPEKPIVLSFASAFPETVGFSKADLRIMEKIENETNGRVQFDIYLAGTLVAPPEMWTELQKGVCDIARPIVQLSPPGPTELLKALEGAYYGCPSTEIELRVIKEVNTKFPEIVNAYSDYGKLITQTWAPPYHLITKEKINTLADFKGKTMRSVATVAKAFMQLGAEGVSDIPGSEVYVAMQKGIIDGTTGAWEQLKASRFAEVGKYQCPLNICQGAVTVPVLMNWDKWNSLPPDVQKVITDNSGLWSDAIIEEMSQADQAGVEFAKGLGNVFYELPAAELSKFYTILDSVYLEEMKNVDAKGYKGTAILQEIRRLIQEYS